MIKPQTLKAVASTVIKKPVALQGSACLSAPDKSPPDVSPDPPPFPVVLTEGVADILEDTVELAMLVLIGTEIEAESCI